MSFYTSVLIIFPPTLKFHKGVHTPFYHSNIQQIAVKDVKHPHKIRYKYVTCSKLIANFITYFTAVNSSEEHDKL